MGMVIKRLAHLNTYLDLIAAVDLGNQRDGFLDQGGILPFSQLIIGKGLAVWLAPFFVSMELD